MSDAIGIVTYNSRKGHLRYFVQLIRGEHTGVLEVEAIPIPQVGKGVGKDAGKGGSN